MSPYRLVRRACAGSIAVAITVAITACTTVPDEPTSVANPSVTPAAPAPKPPAPLPKPKPAPPPRDVEPPVPPPPPSKAVEELRRGQQRYDDGEYREAAGHFQRALEQGLATPADQANARKHLAFIACVARRTSACRTEFRRAFEADATFDLTPAESGHPMWGPVFRSVKAEVAKKRKSAPPSAKPPAASR